MIRSTGKKINIASFNVVGISVMLVISIIISTSVISCKNLGDVSEMLGTFEVTRGDINQSISTTGYVDSASKNDYSVQLSGEVLYALDKGDAFSKGDKLIEVDNSQQELLIAQAEENMNSARSSLETARINYQQALDANHVAIQLAEVNTELSEISAHNAFIALENANNVADKSKESAAIALENAEAILAEAEGDPLITDIQIVQYEYNVETARASYEAALAQGTSSSKSAEGAWEQTVASQSTTYWSNLSSTQSAATQIDLASKNIALAESQVKLSEISLELAKLDTDKNIVYAPYDGIVLSSTYKEGQYSSPGMSAISVISSDFIIKADINEIDVVNIEEGQDVDITLDAYYEDEFSGKITEISPISTNVGGIVSFELIVKPETENAPQLLYGLSASLDITTSGIKDILYVPVESVYEEDGKTYVDMITGEGKIEKKEVTTGTFNYDHIEIKSGLVEGDEILISPMNSITAQNLNLQIN
jgi:HlyD family secretion protein